MRKSMKWMAVVIALLLCLTAIPAEAFAAGNDSADESESETSESDINMDTSVTAIAPAFQRKLLAELYADERFYPDDIMPGIKLAENSDGQGLEITGPVGDLTSTRFTFMSEFDFDEKPEDRNTPVQPVGRICVDGLSDKNAKVTVNVYLDDEEKPRASMLLKKRLGSAGWARKGDRTQDVLSQNITGAHHVSIGLDIQGLDVGAETTVLLRSLTFCENSVPVLYFDIDESDGSIDSMNSSPDHTAECYGTATLQVPEGYTGDYSNKVQTTQENMVLDYLRGRGNSTWDMDKKPYKIKFEDKQNLLGMGKSKHWVLLANRYDNTLLRNRVTYWLGKQMNQQFNELEMGCEFTPKCEPVEVVMNGEYYGSYLLSTQVRLEKNRVEIEDLEDDDLKNGGLENTEELHISGGYLLNMEGFSDDEEIGGFATKRGSYYGFESPDFFKYPDTEEGKAAIKARRDYIAGYFDKVEDALFGSDLKDGEGHSFDEYLDEQSAIDFWWMQEFSMNGDAYAGGSNYLYKRRDKTDEDGNVVISKLHWGPLWDFDYVAWGNPNCDPNSYTNFNNTSNDWMNRLRSDEAYCDKLKARWSGDCDTDNLYSAHLNDLIDEVTKAGGVLDQYYDETRVSQQYDNYKWGFYNQNYGGYSSYGYNGTVEKDNGVVLGEGDGEEDKEGEEDEESGEQEEQDSDQTYESEVAQFRGWIQKRQGWVTENINDIAATTYTVRFLVDGKEYLSRKYTENEALGTLPEAPAKAGYTFIGWYDTEFDIKVDEDTEAYDNFDVKAKYVKTSKLKEPAAIYFSNYDVYQWVSNDEDDAYYPSYVIMPADSLPGEIKWSVSDNNIASVNEEGGVLGRKRGTVTVTATLSSGKKNSYKVTFLADEDDIYEVESISLNKRSLSLKTGQYTQLIADQEPKPHYSTDVEWFSTKPNIVSVDSNGVLEAKRPGKSIIIAIDSESRKFAVCTVTVTASKSYKIKMAKAAKVSGIKARTVRSGKKRYVRVSWKKKSGVSGYYILRASKKNGKYKKVGTVKKAKITKWTDKKVKKGKTYYYKVKPFTKIGKKKYPGKLSKAVRVKVK